MISSKKGKKIKQHKAKSPKLQTAEHWRRKMASVHGKNLPAISSDPEEEEPSAEGKRQR